MFSMKKKKKSDMADQIPFPAMQQVQLLYTAVSGSLGVYLTYSKNHSLKAKAFISLS